MTVAPILSGRIEKRATDGALFLWYVAAIVFLFAPILAALVYSFNVGVVNKQTATMDRLHAWTGFPPPGTTARCAAPFGQSFVVAFWTARRSRSADRRRRSAMRMVRHPKRCGVRKAARRRSPMCC